MAAPSSASWSDLQMYDRLAAFFQRDGAEHPGYIDQQIPRTEGFIPTRYDNGVRWRSSLGVGADGVDWTWYNTDCLERQFRTKDAARHALIDALWNDVDHLEHNSEAKAFYDEHRECRYLLDPQHPRFLENPTAPDPSRLTDLQFIARKFQVLDMRYIIFGKLYARTLATMLDKKLEAVPTSAAFGFMYGFTSLVRSVLLRRTSEHYKTDYRDPYPCFLPRLTRDEQRGLKEVCDATYDYVFTLQNDVTRTAVRRNAAIMGEAVGVALGDVEFKVAMLFNHFLWMNLQKLLLKREHREASVGDGLSDTIMTGM